MFINFNRYCFGGYMGPDQGFLQISNYTSSIIYFIFQYNIQRGLKTKKSPVFEKGYSKKIYFTINSTNRTVNIINDSIPTQPLICNRVLDDTLKYYYFNVVETPMGLTCVANKTY